MLLSARRGIIPCWHCAVLYAFFGAVLSCIRRPSTRSQLFSLATAAVSVDIPPCPCLSFHIHIHAHMATAGPPALTSTLDSCPSCSFPFAGKVHPMACAPSSLINLRLCGAGHINTPHTPIRTPWTTLCSPRPRYFPYGIDILKLTAGEKASRWPLLSLFNPSCLSRFALP